MKIMILSSCLAIYLAEWAICGHLERIKRNHSFKLPYESRLITPELRKLHLDYYLSRRNNPTREFGLSELRGKFKWLCQKLKEALSASGTSHRSKIDDEYYPLTPTDISRDLVDSGMRNQFRCTIKFEDNPLTWHHFYMSEGPPSLLLPMDGCFISIRQKVPGYEVPMRVLADYVLYSRKSDEIIYDTNRAFSLVYPNPPGSDPIQIEREFYKMIGRTPDFVIDPSRNMSSPQWQVEQEVLPPEKHMHPPKRYSIEPKPLFKLDIPDELAPIRACSSLTQVETKKKRAPRKDEQETKSCNTHPKHLFKLDIPQDLAPLRRDNVSNSVRLAKMKIVEESNSSEKSIKITTPPHSVLKPKEKKLEGNANSVPISGHPTIKQMNDKKSEIRATTRKASELNSSSENSSKSKKKMGQSGDRRKLKARLG